MHVTSSIDGDIAVFQRASDGRQLKLFPDDRIHNGSSLIARGVDTALPSPTSWFRFDHQPGTEELTLVLTPRAALTAPPGSPVSIQNASLQYEEIGLAAGSKGLVVETDSVGPAQGTYVVRRSVVGRPPEPIVMAVRFKHR